MLDYNDQNTSVSNEINIPNNIFYLSHGKNWLKEVSHFLESQSHEQGRRLLVFQYGAITRKDSKPEGL